MPVVLEPVAVLRAEAEVAEPFVPAASKAEAEGPQPEAKP